MARKPSGCHDEPLTQTEIVHAEQGQVHHQSAEQTTLPQSVEVHNGLFKALDGCSQADFFDAHLLAKERSVSHARAAEFCAAAAEYYKRLSGVI